MILNRKDLTKYSSDKKASHLTIRDFIFNMELFAKQNMIIFIDDNGETRILKSRWGDVGKVIKYKRKRMLAGGGSNVVFDKSKVYHIINNSKYGKETTV